MNAKTLKKHLPYIFLITLALITVFLFGVKYGRKVEKLDKYFYFSLSLTPKQKLSPTQNPLSFKLVNFKECKVQFVIPEAFKISKDKQILRIKSEEKVLAEIKCSKKRTKTELAGKKVLLKLKNIPIQAFEKNAFIHFKYQPENNKLFYEIKIVSDLFPLFSKTVDFLP